ncbi:hypothetical protein K470DRAFT_159245 [Piedraia hortae CBS 480.64]|uniref:NWD NACHT-NTPase N-terminal domain-containing protein n=1 Tax=Piedraia hortae CBS 480.64 TaxID=1314780 RepID=A0A6A7BSP0_9PEZI|nr:hypothetical protein K470DRAFT_159245 [Piedraia hortae CBS 480.64]
MRIVRGGTTAKAEMVVAGLHRLRNTDAALASSKALPLGLIWGSINVLVVPAVERKARRGSVIDAPDTVTYICCLLTMYHDWFCKLPSVEAAERLADDLVDLFAQFYRIMANAMLSQSDDAWKRLCNTVKNEHNLKSMLQRCRNLHIGCEIA